ncbi:hypothetical protein [Paenibacillus terreus]|uniref:hypothetical protein n=1 Tax=Paenibacillus terreus TaxID=1387834 RepID=UPI0035CD2426
MIPPTGTVCGLFDKLLAIKLFIVTVGPVGPVTPVIPVAPVNPVMPVTPVAPVGKSWFHI